MAKTTKSTKQTVKVIPAQANEAYVGGLDNPISQQTLITSLYKLNEEKSALAKKYNIQFGGLTLLLRLSYNWVNTHCGMTIYELSGNRQGKVTSVSCTVGLLYEKGLLEVVGNSHYKARLYAPSTLALRELSSIRLN